MSLPSITGIMAADPRGVVGKGNGLPWYYPDELAYFQQLTRGHVVVMGRKTFETIPLLFFEERTPVVFSRHDYKMPACTIVSSIEDFLTHLDQWEGRKIFVIGGAEITHLFLQHGLLTDFILTKIHKSYTGDVSLKLTLLEEWSETTLLTTDNYTICHLKAPHCHAH